MSFGEVQLHVVHEHVSVERVKPAAGTRRRVVRRVDTAENARVARCQHVLDVIDGGKNERAIVVPCSTLHSCFSQRRQNLQLLVAYNDSVRTHERDVAAVGGPRNVLGAGGDDFGDEQLLRAVEQNDAIVTLAQQVA